MTDDTTAQQGEPEGKTATAAQEASATEQNINTTEQKPADGDNKPDKKEWYIDVITALRAKNRDALTEKETLMLENAELKQKLANPNPETGTKNITDEEINRLANDKAKNIAAADRFNEKCNNVANAGKSEFADFDSALANLAAVGAVGPNANQSFLEVVTELPNAHKVLHHLGKNPEEAARINSLPPTRMAIELSKIENSLSAPRIKPISGAPAPITPVNGKGKADVDLSDPNVDTAVWMAKRRKDKEAQFKAQ